MQIDLRVGDCVEVLKSLPDESVDSCVTDPPYGLGKPPPIEDVLRAWLAGERYTPKSKAGGFMGKKWDAFVPDPDVWREVFRVLKPGGHLLAFAGSRTVDLMGLSIRLAGFEIRDQLQWLYGQGFPKSSDISKSIDKAAGAERERLPDLPQPGSQLQAMSGSARAPESKWMGIQLGGPATREAEQWGGWGTALKPGHEPIVMARKPFKGPVFRQVMATGTGAINIDSCRIGSEGGVRKIPGTIDRSGGHMGVGFGCNGDTESVGGRWPANVLLDAEAAAMLDAQSGTKKAGKPRSDRGTGGIWSPSMGVPCGPQYGDRGGASRFFYCAKASKKERDRGLTGAEEARYSGGHGGASIPLKGSPMPTGKNIHPTVKPVALMRWLVRLVTPPGGVVLDPFAGSGTTLVAAKEESFESIGAELSEEYAGIARQRYACG